VLFDRALIPALSERLSRGAAMADWPKSWPTPAIRPVSSGNLIGLDNPRNAAILAARILGA
jgi:hypothetical protein